MHEEKLQEIKDKLFAFSALASSMVEKSIEGHRDQGRGSCQRGHRRRRAHGK